MKLIAIDPGVKNGIAIYDNKTKQWIRTGEYSIWDTFEILDTFSFTNEDRIDCMVYLEDPRQIGGPQENALGAGWVRVLAGQYETYLRERGFKYKLIRPDGTYTKKDSSFVKINTGIDSKKGQHNMRDAIMILFFYAI